MLPAGMDPRTPVLVGVGQVVHRNGELGLPGPVELAAEALRRAGADSGTGDKLLRAADLVASIAPVSRTYPDLGTLVAAELGTSPKRTWQSAPFGGDGPQRLLNAVAGAIADGTVDVALLAGAEAVASRNAAKKTGATPDWPEQAADVRPDKIFGADSGPNSEMENTAGLWGPIYMYPLMESAMRGKLGLGVAEHQRRIGTLWSRFSSVAANNPHAWLPTQRSVEELITPAPDNRMVSSPYPKLLVANLTVDQGAGLILCSAAAADAAGVPREQWVFPHSGATATDTWFVSERADMAASPAIAAAGRTALVDAGVGIDDIAHIDLYSCFPIAVQVGAAALGLPIDDPNRPLTVTGGLTFGGGPGNNYTTHAIATMAERLRANPGDYGLTTSLGWYITKHGVGVYSTEPPARLFRAVEHHSVEDRRETAPGYTGPATVEAFTVPYRKSGDGDEPEAVVISALNPAGARILVRVTDADIIAACTDGDPLGASAEITAVDRITLSSERKA
ncbi:acetyl-CoA acetyltransferase [Nocardia donostiensis]|uniref:Acetyl-CoA acetyltransferase n=2 Tax=Nocardia donostiensis TaxID=1538463 RepID=A0A1V2TJB2_9NOCA|nr:acetyl-CoA acetyltransferase [Nocardia donostiensis]ONM49441.1 acetyl-CoA acetyltransferase [Nocardia donostiensis]OQS13580.1 acetyl-CoA acetyltransferase [Nocardia donostiensis]OQS19918.1 acetyl-CoA acetyltransferase [Nocardia donostiensis]